MPIPRRIWQTSHLDASLIPDLLGSHAKGYERNLFTDADCETFLREHFPHTLPAFQRLEGAHRADLWRYCVLYKHGGVYLDVKTVLRAPLETVFDDAHDKFTWYAVICSSNTCIYNGIIATPPGNAIFLDLIDHIMAHNPPSRYHEYVEHMMHVITAKYGPVQGEGVLENAHSRLCLLQEVCNPTQCAQTPKKRADRYGLCCNIYNRAIQLEPIISVRDPDYPWDGKRDPDDPSDGKRDPRKRKIKGTLVIAITGCVVAISIALIIWQWHKTPSKMSRSKQYEMALPTTLTVSCVALIAVVAVPIAVLCRRGVAADPAVEWPSSADGLAIPPLLWRTHDGALRDTLRGNADGLDVKPVSNDASRRAFLVENYPETVDGYDALPTGAHRADLWRYAVLHKHGGIYMDIKCVPFVPLRALIDRLNAAREWCVVASTNADHIFNAIILTPPGNPILHRAMMHAATESRLIGRTITADPPLGDPMYLDLCRYLGELCSKEYNTKLKRAPCVARSRPLSLRLLRERCDKNSECHVAGRLGGTRLDRYGNCCNVYDKGVERPLFQCRDPSYPWRD